MSGLPLALVLFLALLAVTLLFRGRQMRVESGLPEGDVI